MLNSDIIKSSAEDSLRQHRTYADDMLFWAGIGRWEIDVATGSITISSDFIERYGYNPVDFFPLTLEKWMQVIHPDDLQSTATMFQQAIAGQVEMDTVYRMAAADGEWRYFRVRGGITEYMPDKKSSKVISGTLQDVTELKIAEKELCRRDELLAATNEAASILLAANNSDFDESVAKVLQILGTATEADRVYVWQNYYQDNERYGTQIYEWSSDAGSARGNEFTTNVNYKKIIPRWEKLLSAGNSVNNLLCQVPAEERAIFEEQGIISNFITPILFQGEFWGFIGFDDCHQERIWNESEKGILQSAGILLAAAIQRKKTELELLKERQILDWIIDTSPIAIVTVNKGLVERMNRRSIELFGINTGMPATFFTGQILGENKNCLDRKNVVKEILEKGIFVRHGIQFKCLDGITRDFILVITQYDPDNLQTMITWIVDISELKKIERDLVQAKNSAEVATRTKSEFLARMSHEIRTPMNAIHGMIYLCLQTELNEKQRDYLSKTQTAAKNLLGIINDILDFSKVEAGKIELETISFSLKNMIAEVVDTVSIIAKNKNLKLLTDIDPDIHDHLLGDSLRLRQVLLNLVNNAVKFTDQGSVTIAVKKQEKTSEKSDANEEHLQFSVKDTGIGLSRKQMDTIFDSFAQADGSTTRKYGGTGLGLAIVRSLVELMGGEINVTSKPKQGAVFHFTVTFPHSDEVTDESSDVFLDKHKVLIVDDDINSREIVTNLVRSLKMNSEAVASGEEAIEKLIFASNSGILFDLMLIDWKMPRMDGIETIRRIYNHPYIKLPPHILMISAYDRQECIRQIQGLNVSNVLIKPIEIGSLKEALRYVFLEDVTLIQNEEKADIRGAKILLVEDNKINQLVASELLKILQVELMVANNGLEAVEAVNNYDFDLVLMDIQMPEMDGLTATQMIRKLDKPGIRKLPILAMTANAMDSDYQKSLDVGMNDHLTKPIDPDKLRLALEKWIVRN